MKHALFLVFAILTLSCSAWAVNFNVSGQGLPGSATSPKSDQGKTLSTSAVVTLIVIANTSGSSQTVTVKDCQSTPFYLFDAYPIPALTTWVLTLGQGIHFAGCLQWAASATSVMGTLSGDQ